MGKRRQGQGSLPKVVMGTAGREGAGTAEWAEDKGRGQAEMGEGLQIQDSQIVGVDKMEPRPQGRGWGLKVASQACHREPLPLLLLQESKAVEEPQAQEVADIQVRRQLGACPWQGAPEDSLAAQEGNPGRVGLLEALGGNRNRTWQT